MFCPNCGTQNADTSATCQKCGFKIKETSQPRFKGTMLMSAPAELEQLRQAVQAATPAAAAAAAATTPSSLPANSPAGPAPAAGAAPATGPTGTTAMPKQSFKGTMIGVAPPSFAGAAGAPAINVSQVPSTTADSPGAIAAKGPPPVSPVNPLGGTLIADRGAAGVQNLPQPQGLAPAPQQSGPHGEILASTMPSVHSPVPNAQGFANTTPSAGSANPAFAQLSEKQPVIRTRPMPQAQGGSQTTLLVFSILLLCVALAALVWSIFSV